MHKDTKVRPASDRVLLKEVQSEDLPRESGLVVPDSAKAPETIFEIVAVGPDVKSAKIGNRLVIGSPETGIRPIAIKLGDETHVLILENHILAFLDC